LRIHIFHCMTPFSGGLCYVNFGIPGRSGAAASFCFVSRGNADAKGGELAENLTHEHTETGSRRRNQSGS
jgi:hypothetical protein